MDGAGDRESEATWFRLHIIRLRAALRYAVEPRVELILRETIADMEDRLEELEAGLAESRPARKKSLHNQRETRPTRGRP
jgi:hypothetical protein